MNKVFLIGRLSRDPETDFINVVVWDKQAENVSKYLAKGRQVAVEGRIQTRSYDNNEGKKTYVTEVVANSVEFLGTVGDNNKQQTTEENPFDDFVPEDDVRKSSLDHENTDLS